MVNTTTNTPPTQVHPAKYCTEISNACPLSLTVYGYYPSVSINTIFLVIFGLLCIVQFIQGLRFKTWTYMVALTLGSLAEAIGYAARISMSHNPFLKPAFDTQIICIILAPVFLAAGIYLLLKHTALTISPALSPLRPHLYTQIFITCDILSLVLQGAGAGVAATATVQKSVDVGNNLMMAGIGFQACTLLIFVAVSVQYASRVVKHRRDLVPAATRLLATRRFRLFVAAVAVACITIFTRCIYRIAEMAGGWKNPIMQDQGLFVGLDGVMVVIAVVALTVAHPGWLVPELGLYGKGGRDNSTVEDEGKAYVELSATGLKEGGRGRPFR